MFHPIMKVKFTRALGSTTQAATIKSQLGCMLRKQIAMIIPTCHPATALKHPSIRLPCNTLRPKQSSLFTSLSRTLAPTCRPCSPLPAHLSLIMVCQLFAGQRAKIASTLTYTEMAVHGV